MRRSCTALLVCLASASATAQKQDGPVGVVAPEAPMGLPSPVPGTARFDPAVAELGRALFIDPILSIDRKTSCASCHDPKHGFASPEPLPKGSLGRRALRHSPTLYNRAYGQRFSWDGRASTLEEQVVLPIENPNEMALPIRDAIARLRKHATHGKAFDRAFGRPANRADLGVSLASYVRTLVHGDTVVDRFRAGTGSRLMTKAERAGLWIFESKGGCWKCHNGGNFTDESFHNTGVGAVNRVPRPGRMGVTGASRDLGRFKTPTLRGLTETAPYMHDGSIATLRGVVDFYRRGGNANKNLDPKMQPLKLSDEEAENLVAFLRALSRRPPKPARKR